MDSQGFQRIVGQLHDPVIVVDGDWRCLYLNEKAVSMARQPAEELAGRALWVIFPEIVGTRVEEELRRAKSSASAGRFEFLHSQSRLWFELDVYPASEGTTILFRDISERKYMEEQLQQELKQLNDFFENSAVAIHWVGPDGRVLWVNQAELDMLGYSKEEYVGEHISKFHVDTETITNILARLRAGETIEGYEARLRCKSGAIKDVLISSNVLWQKGQFIHTRCFTFDITGRKHWERSQALLAAIVDTCEDAIITKTLQGTVLSWNASAERIFGYSADEAVGKPITFLVPADRPDEETQILARLARGERVEHFETVRRRKDGTLIHVSLSISPIKDSAGTIVGASKIARDVTARRKSDEALQASEERFRSLAQANSRLYVEAERANRLKDEFLATMSHELRTPLNSIFGWTQMVRGGALSESVRDRALQSIERSARAQLRLIEDLLDVSSIIMGKVRLVTSTVDLPAVIEAAVEAIRPSATLKGIHLDVHIDPQADVLYGDAERLQQVIWNLLSNAIKFTPKDGRVELHAERSESHVAIAVKDTGEGIAPDFLPHVFDRFRQQESSTARRKAGMGLGLAIVRHMVELHGGTVQASSEGPQRGSTSTVMLPVSSVRAAARMESEMAEERDHPSRLQGVRLLIVDDDDDARMLLSTILEGYGATVTAVASAEEALVELLESRPDLLISDIGMPVVDGYALIKRIRAHPHPNVQAIPAVALTAHARRQDRLQALNAGYDGHIAKPFDPVELGLALSRLLSDRSES